MFPENLTCSFLAGSDRSHIFILWSILWHDLLPVLAYRYLYVFYFSQGMQSSLEENVLYTLYF